MLRACFTLLRTKRCQLLLKIAFALGFVLTVYIHLRPLQAPHVTLPERANIYNGAGRRTGGEPQKNGPSFKHIFKASTNTNVTSVISIKTSQPEVINQVLTAMHVLPPDLLPPVSPPIGTSAVHKHPIQFIQDIQDEAYAAAETPEFKKEISDNKFRFTNNAGLNKSEEVITVLLMPHSHNDPGWLSTFDVYQLTQTRPTLDNLVKFLNTVDEEMPFQWSESVSLLRWYKKAREQSKKVIKDAIQRKNFMIDHGSWSMPDEASVSLYSLIENLMIGHTWIYNEFGIKPEYSWSNDPFGHSSTIPYLLKQCGIKAMAINRIDMLLKKRLRESQMLEFYWRPSTGQHTHSDTDEGFLSDGKKQHGDMFTHVLPYNLYSTKQSFGPDLRLALSYDFSPQEVHYTPIVDASSGKPVVSEEVLEERAKLLSEQIHLRSAMFKHNVVLSPIGDDMRYSTYSEFEGVYKNWNYLKDYYNRVPEHKVKLQLGTLADYFSLIGDHVKVKVNEYPVLSGDFFPYSDNSDEKPHDVPSAPGGQTAVYWTGYFTTRPALKVGLRRLETLLRQTEILYSLYKLHMGPEVGAEQELLTKDLSLGRETLSWLLHHDAITGTSPTNVAEDFLKHLKKATVKLEQFSLQVMSRLSFHQAKNSLNAHRSMNVKNTDRLENANLSLEMAIDTLPHVLVLPTTAKSRKVLLLRPGEERAITLYNSLAHNVNTVAHIGLQILKSRLRIQLKDSTGADVSCQLNPFFKFEQQSYQISEHNLELVFEIVLPALGMRTYTISTTTKVNEGSCSPSTIGMTADQLHLFGGNSVLSEGIAGFPVTKRDRSNSTRIYSKLNEVRVSSNTGSIVGLKSVQDGWWVDVKQEFGLYNKGRQNSQLENGLYIFTTNDEGSIINNGTGKQRSMMYTVIGHVESATLTVLPHVTQCIRINNVEPGIAISQQVTLGSESGDLFSRFISGIASGNTFYTDSNSFTLVKRRRNYPRRPISANFYPMTNSLYIEGSKRRLTLLSYQPLGVTSLHEGQLEVMLARQHFSHDRAGVNDNLVDGKSHFLQFRLLSEQLVKSKAAKAGPSLSAVAFHQSIKLSYPVSAYSGITVTATHFSTIQLSCDYHLVALRSLDTLPYGAAKQSDVNSVALVLQRLSTAQTVNHFNPQICSDNNQVTLNLSTSYAVQKTSLTLLYSQGTLDPANIPPLQPDTLQTYKISPIH